jgi:peptidoglycan/LPS O-acetylase OafA/YrhL
MRITAGVVLIILGVWALTGLIGGVIIITGVSGGNPYLPFFLWRIICVPFLITGGVFCLRQKYWRVCLASALVAVFVGIAIVVAPLLDGRYFFVNWQTLVMFVGGLIATIFVSLRKKEWQGVSDSVDGKTSYDG